jgi:hypothetical protein
MQAALSHQLAVAGDRRLTTMAAAIRSLSCADFLSVTAMRLTVLPPRGHQPLPPVLRTPRIRKSAGKSMPPMAPSAD